MTENNRRLPVPVDALPLADRLLFVLSEIEQVAEKAAREKALKKHNEAQIREAITYMPPFAQQIIGELIPTLELLKINGFVKQTDSVSQHQKIVDDKVEETLRDFTFKPQVEDKTRASRDVLRQISKVLHPDSIDPSTEKIISQDEGVEIYSTVMDLAGKEKAEKAQEVLLETMPRILLAKIKKMLSQGMSFAQIAENNSELVADLENLRWIASVRLPKDGVYRRFGEPDEAEKKAKDMKKKDDCHAGTIGYGIICGTVDDILSFAKSRKLNPELVEKIEVFVKYMKDVGGYVGGVGEFVYEKPWIVTPYLAMFGKPMEEAIQGLIPDVYQLAGAVISVDKDVLETTIARLRESVTDLKFKARRYGEELVRAANPTLRTRDTSSIPYENFPEKIIKEYNNKNW